MSSTQNIDPVEHPNKKRKCLRVTLDVGGTKFVTVASTLTPNSTYFAAQFSDNWKRDDEDGEDEVFLDQDPVPFGILLAYMRRGMIKVDDVNTDVLALAEFLGMDRLLLAVKVRWYCNIGKGPVVSKDEEIAAAFDQHYGGILKAISAGFLPYFLKRSEVDCDKDLATIELCDQAGWLGVTIQVAQSPSVKAGCLIGALNGLHLQRYTKHESQLGTSTEYSTSTVFSRIRHNTIASDAVEIFIPTDNEVKTQMENSFTKQFAMLLEGKHNANDVTNVTIAPAEFSDDPQKRVKPYAVATFPYKAPLLNSKCFDTREEEYEKLFRGYISEICDEHLPLRRHSAAQCKIFSRKIHVGVSI